MSIFSCPTLWIAVIGALGGIIALIKSLVAKFRKSKSSNATQDITVETEQLSQQDIEYLIRCLNDSCYRARIRAVHNLGEFKIASSLPALIKRAEKEDDEDVKEEIVYALSKIATPEAIEYIREMIEDDCENVREAAERCLKAFTVTA